MKAVQVAVAYSALRHLNPEVTKGLGARIHQTFGFRLWRICAYEKHIILEVIISTSSRYIMTELRMMRTMILSVTRQNLRRERGMLGWAPRSEQICTSASSKGGLIRQLEEARFLMHDDNIPGASRNCKFSTTVGKLFLQQSKREKGLSAQSNAVLDPDYLDAMVRFFMDRGRWWCQSWSRWMICLCWFQSWLWLTRLRRCCAGSMELDWISWRNALCQTYLRMVLVFGRTLLRIGITSTRRWDLRLRFRELGLSQSNS